MKQLNFSSDIKFCHEVCVCFLMYRVIVSDLFVFVATAPQWSRASSFTSFLDHNDAPQSVGLLWTSDQLVAETST